MVDDAVQSVIGRVEHPELHLCWWQDRLTLFALFDEIPGRRNRDGPSLGKLFYVSALVHHIQPQLPISRD
jgi:hypothetical protein